MERIYKNSGIEWIGRIPEDWQYKRFKYSGIFEKGKLPESSNIENNGKPIIGASEMLGKDARTYTMDESVPQCKEDDILILWDGANAGITATGLKGVVSSTAVKYSCTDNSVLSKYAAYVLKHAEHYFKEKVNGTTIPHMNMAFINDFPLLFPPMDEQQRIADYLDEKCGEIDSLIGLQEQMIEKLKAYKQSVITEAVTKGLNPNAKLVPSGIDWIGEIPEGWKVTVLRRFSNIILGKMLQPNAKFKEDTLEQYICAKDVHFEGIDISDLKKMYFNRLEKEMYQVHKGDMLVVEGGAGAAGSCVLKTDLANTYIQNSIMIVRPKQGIDIRFIQFYEFSLVKKGYVDYVCNKATIPHFTKDKLSSMPIPLPPLSEQQTIASYLEGKCSEIDSLIDVKEKKIEKLKDYKKSVIYEAVTGKIKID